MPTELNRRPAEGDLPEALRDVLMPFPWRLDLLRALDLPRVKVAVSDFDWMLDRPLWRHEDTWFAVAPREVSQNPDAYAKQWDRTQRADLSWPVHITELDERLVIIDGIHRLLRATIEGVRTLPALHLSPPCWSAIRA